MTTKTFSGAENVAITIIKNTNNIVNHTYVSPIGKNIKKRLDEENINYYGIKKFDIKGVIDAYKVLKPDIIHAHDFTATFYACFLKIINRKLKIISHIHQDPIWIHKKSFKNCLFFFIFNFIDYFILVNANIKEKSIFSDCKKCVLIPNIVDVADVVEKANEFSCESFDYIYIGRLEPVKDPLLLINILYKYKKYNQDYRCAFIGDGSLFNECQKKLDDLKLNENIQLCGFVENPYPYLNSSKVLLISSKTEGLPIVLNEAICLGKPIITTDIPTFKNLNEEFILMSKDEDEYISNLQLLNDDDIYNRLVNDCTLYASINFDIKKYCEKIINLY